MNAWIGLLTQAHPRDLVARIRRHQAREVPDFDLEVGGAAEEEEVQRNRNHREGASYPLCEPPLI